MSLDVCVLREIDHKIMIRKPKEMVCPELDEAVLNYINRVPLAHDQPYLRAKYVKYYFNVKREYVEKKRGE